MRAGDGEGRDCPHLLAVERQPLAARGEDPRHGTAGQDELARCCHGLDDMFGVVEHDQYVEGADPGQGVSRRSAVGDEAQR